MPQGSVALAVNSFAAIEDHQRAGAEVVPILAVRQLSRGDDEALLFRGFFFAEVYLPVLVTEADLAERCPAVRVAKGVVSSVPLWANTKSLPWIRRLKGWVFRRFTLPQLAARTWPMKIGATSVESSRSDFPSAE